MIVYLRYPIPKGTLIRSYRKYTQELHLNCLDNRPSVREAVQRNVPESYSIERIERLRLYGNWTWEVFLKK